MVLFLRRWHKQDRIEGRQGESLDTYPLDYAVVDDVKIGRVRCRDDEPLQGHWDWFFHLYGNRDGVQIHGTALTLDEAKAAIKAEYEKWLALNPTR
jgi:hypothetical protein